MKVKSLRFGDVIMGLITIRIYKDLYDELLKDQKRFRDKGLKLSIPQVASIKMKDKKHPPVVLKKGRKKRVDLNYDSAFQL